MTYLVTGGAGFIGSHIAEHLCAQGEQVTVLDNFSTGKHKNLANLPVRLVTGDIRNPKCVAKALKGVDTVFHQAALCSEVRSIIDPLTTHEVNTTGTLNLLEACRKAGVRRVVMASSSSVYGDSESIPKHEQIKTDPLSPYAVSKLNGEHFCQLYWKTFGLETVALRYFNVFGPRQDPDSEYSAMIPHFIEAMLDDEQPRIYGEGLQSRDFTFIQDVVTANIAAATSSAAPGQVMNIACGNLWSQLDVINGLETILECRTNPVFQQRDSYYVLHSKASIDKARELIGFKPQTSFLNGLRQTVEWAKSKKPVNREMVPRLVSYA